MYVFLFFFSKNLNFFSSTHSPPIFRAKLTQTKQLTDHNFKDTGVVGSATWRHFDANCEKTQYVSGPLCGLPQICDLTHDFQVDQTCNLCL